MTELVKLAVLASGGGRGLQNLMDRCGDGRLPAEVVAVGVSSRKAYAHERAEAADIPAFICPKKRGQTSQDYSRSVFEALAPYEPDWICLSGFLSLLIIPEAFRGRVLNIHPSLIPAHSGAGFYGMRVHRSVAAAGESVSGCTVHVCDNIYDHGPILLQVRVPLTPGLTPEAIADRVFAAELLAYPRVIAGIAEGRVGQDPDGAWRGCETLNWGEIEP